MVKINGRISRSLVTVIFLTLFQVIAGPILAPQSSTPQANAANSEIIQAGLDLDANAVAGANDVTASMTFGSVSPIHTNSGVGYYTFDGTLNKYAYAQRNFADRANVSIFMWVYPTAAGVLLSHNGQADPYDGYRLSTMVYTSAGKFQSGLYNSGAVFTTSTSNTPIGNWYYVGLTYDGSKVRQYINGQLDGEVSMLNWTTAPSDFFHIGASQNGTCFGACPTPGASFRFGELSIYRSTLSGADVTANFTATRSRFAPSFTNPANFTTFDNRNATFSTGTCTSTSLTACTYQWERSINSGSSWSDVSGAIASSLTLSQVQASMSGYQYRVKVTDPGASSPSSTALTKTSAAATLSVSTPPGSDTDTALTFNGTNQYLQASDPGTSAFDVTGTFTFEAWVKPENSCSSDQTVFTKYLSYMLYCSSGYWNYMILANGASGTGAATTIKVEAGAWHHLALTKNSGSGDLLIYYDGALAQTIATGVTTMTANDQVFRIGQYNSSKYFQGQIDEVRVYNSQRTASQIKADMNSYGSISDANLNLYYDFNEETGTTLYNRDMGALAETDLALINFNLPAWSDVKDFSTTAQTNYTVVKFPRSYLTSVGGWTVPTGVTRVQVLIVAGGGGGGGGYQGGGGGAGGFIETVTSITSGNRETITVGGGGLGFVNGSTITSRPTKGHDSVAFGLTANGGGYGASEPVSPYGHYPASSGGSGGGGTWGNTASYYTGGAGTTGQGFKGGDNLANCCIGAGGGGASAAGTNASASAGGAGGAGRLSSITGTYFAGGGGGAFRDTVANSGAGGLGGGGDAAKSTTALPDTTNGAKSGTFNTGGGGGAGVKRSPEADGAAGNGGSGYIAIRWITASEPTFTPPTIAYLNVGMTETFTTNVAADSATANLTRTFRWESSTTGIGGPYSLIKQGTGASNASFSWVPTDTSTTGVNFRYRVTVTDSDTAGLFITKTSTPVYAIINRALSVSGVSTINKAINVTRNEAFTISLGTSTYRSTLLPVIPGITLDTSTAGTALIRISDTASIGTYFETLTVTDSVSAVVSIPLTINVIAPPSLTNSGEIVTTGQIFNFDAANSASYNRATKSLSDISGAQHPITANNGVTFSEDNSGFISLSNSSNQYLSATGFAQLDKFTIEAYVRLDSITAQSCILTSEKSSINVGFTLCIDVGRTVFTGFYNGDWTYKRTSQTLTLGQWTHIVGAFDGSNVNLYFDGVSTTSLDVFQNAGLIPPALSTDKIYIGRTWVTGSTTTASTSLGFVRLYNIGFAQSDVSKNYNATKDRFASLKINKIKPTQKYGALNLETFTVTSGGETKTVAFTIGNRTGINWDTATAGLLKLSVQESLTPGTYYDTITVTDNLSQSIILPIQFTISKADSITVTIRNPKTLTYTGNSASSLPDIAVTGLVSSDTGTASRLYSAPASLVGAPDSYAALINSSNVPSDVETYTVSAATPVLTRGSLTYYEGVIYETSTLTITQANQPSLMINYYGAVAGANYYLTPSGGGGTGFFTETLTAGSSGLNCTLVDHVLANSSPSNEVHFCNIIVTRAASRNYKIESMTASIYFLPYVNNQPTQSGGGSSIGLSGETDFEIDPNLAPSITGFSTSTLSLSASGNFTITGIGFGPSPVTVKFSRNKVVYATSTNGTTLVIPISSISNVVPTTGSVLVINANGIAVSPEFLNIVP